MSETLRDHTLAWLDSIGADGLMQISRKGSCFCETSSMNQSCKNEMDCVPAFRHADGSYHVEADTKNPCLDCMLKTCNLDDICECEEYTAYQSWLANKEKK